jgi:hypothetical protein
VKEPGFSNLDSRRADNCPLTCGYIGIRERASQAYTNGGLAGRTARVTDGSRAGKRENGRSQPASQDGGWGGEPASQSVSEPASQDRGRGWAASVRRGKVNDSDFPWLLAHAVALPGFEELRPLFDEELRCLDPESDEGLSLRDTDRSLWSTNGF